MLKPLLLDLAGAHWVMGSLVWDPTLENWGEQQQKPQREANGAPH